MAEITPRARTIILTDAGTFPFSPVLAAYDGTGVGAGAAPTPTPAPTPAPTPTPTPTPAPTPTPTPTLGLTGTRTYSTTSSAGTVVAAITGVPSGSTPAISPNDGRLVIAGSEGAGWRLAVGLTASSAGERDVTISAPGANSVTASVRVIQGLVGEPSNLIAFRPLGSNLASDGLIDFGGSWPLLDRARPARYMTHDYHALAPEAMDARGYPIGKFRILFSVEGPRAPDGMTKLFVIRTTLTSAVSASGCVIQSDTPAGNGQPRTIIVDTPSPNFDTGWRSELLFEDGFGTSGTGTINIMRQDQVAAFDAGKTFNPAYIADHTFYGHLRTMDWQNTNGSPQTTWESRPKLTDANYNTAPIELCVDLINECGTDMWACVPAMATDDYVRQMARLILQRLAPNRRLNLEYSNERWNDSFTQGAWMHQQLPKIPGASWQSWGWGGYRAAQVAAIFLEEWGDQAYRIISHLGTQQPRLAVRDDNIVGVQYAISEWSDPQNAKYSAVRAANFQIVSDLFDEVSITGYTSGGMGGGIASAYMPIVEQWADANDIDAAFRPLYTGSEF